MGIEFVKGKVAKIGEDEAHNPMVRVEMIDEGSRVVERQHDLVVLSVGMVPASNPHKLYGVSIDEDDGFIRIPAPNFSPSATDRPGIFVTGTAAGPMDIVDSIVLAGAAAAETAAYLEAKHRVIPGNGRPAIAVEETELTYV
jgi:heterodisulfide reductase subunit A